MDHSALEREATKLVSQHISKYKDPQVFITENVSFSIRPLVRLLRKNYYGVFDTPTDKSTGRKKIWIPLTMTMCDAVRKNSDIDTKDATFTSRNKKGIASTEVVRAVIRRELDDTYFGQDLDMAISTLSIDPTIVWKLTKYKKGGKTHVNRQQIDILNVYIDPSAKSLHDVDFAERALMTKQEMEEMDGWINVDKVIEQENLSRYDDIARGTRTSNKMVEVFEFYGMVPEHLITGEEGDKKKVPARIVTSGTGDAVTLHYIERNTLKDKHGNSIKPYEEAWYSKLPWSWYGISPAWKVLDLQEYINTTVNIRINRNTVAQYGIFKMKEGSGIKQKDFARLGSNGVIKVRNMDDLEQFQVQEAGASSYKDEEVAKQWATEVTSAFDTLRGAPSPASATATAQVLESTSGKESFQLIKDSVGYFLERVIDRHYLPLVPAMVKEEGIIRIQGDTDNIDELRNRVAGYLVSEALNKTSFVPTQQEFEREVESVMERLRSDKDLFIENLEDIMVSTIDTRVQWTNEKMDTNVLTQNLISIMGMVPPELQKPILDQVFDMVGLTRIKAPVMPQQVPGQVPGMAPQGIPTPQSITTEAVTAGMQV